MSAVVLRPIAEPSVPLEAESVRPDAFAELGESEIARLEVWHGNERARLGDFFDVHGERVADVRIAGSAARVKWLGAAMAGGSLTIEGDAGMHAGAGMTGGRLRIEGRADDWCGAEMACGTLEVLGGVGDHAGGAYPGSPRGMTGGMLVIHGDAGEWTADRMRRGLIAVTGRCGDHAALDMIAGTLLVVGAIGRRPALGMRRGTVVAAGPVEILPTFRYACEYRPHFLALYLHHLRAAHGFPVEERLLRATWRRYTGDYTEMGKGEILTCRTE